MAKDAKGHGSEARAVRSGSYDGKPVFHGVHSGGTVKNHFGNPIAYASPEAAVAGAVGAIKPILSVAESAAHAGFGADKAAASALDTGHPKSAPVDTHPSMAGGKSVVPRDVAANFARGGKYGAPSKGFASGAREIKQLRGNASPMSRAYQKSIGKH